MPEEVNILGPGGIPRKAVDVPIVKSIERTSEVELEDGTILYIKASPISVQKAIDAWDAHNNPLYSVQSNTVIGVKFCKPDNKRRD